jgi:hypothetical protein
MQLVINFLGCFYRNKTAGVLSLPCDMEQRCKGCEAYHSASCISEFCFVQNIGCILAIGLCVRTTVCAIETYFTASRIVIEKVSVVR